MRAEVLALWCLGASLVLFFLMGFDKRRAKRHGARINEATLFAWALLGGAPGGWLGMRVFHHKTRHWYFKWGLPATLIAQLALGIWLFWIWNGRP